MSRVLVTGATGFVGQFCLPLLVAKGHDVHAVSRHPGSNVHEDVRWHHADLLDLEQGRTLIADIQPTHLLHLAWCTGHGTYWDSAENVRWVEASLRLVSEFVSHGGSRLVVAGTCAEYGSAQNLLSENDTPLRPTTLYGTCKHALHLILERVSPGMAWARLFHLYGPNEDERRFIPHIITSLLGGSAAECRNGRLVRDYLYVKDASHALVALLLSEVSGAVNVASGTAISLREIALMVGDRIGASHLIRFGSPEPEDVQPLAIEADVRRLRDEVIWTPMYSMAAALDETIDWHRQRLSGGSY